MKYAIAQTSGKQILVKPGQWYDVDYISEGNLGDVISLRFYFSEKKIRFN
jgi:ribosomal protein L21